jgi:peptidyl-tRNA hydrolase ICT1
MLKLVFPGFSFAKLLKLSEIKVPVEKLTTSYCRSSGPGGFEYKLISIQSQHVNKTNSKAEIRFHVPTADWLDDRVKKNLLQNYSNHINKDCEFVLTSQHSRA